MPTTIINGRDETRTMIRSRFETVTVVLRSYIYIVNAMIYARALSVVFRVVVRVRGQTNNEIVHTCQSTVDN